MLFKFFFKQPNNYNTQLNESPKLKTNPSESSPLKTSSPSNSVLIYNSLPVELWDYTDANLIKRF